MLFSVIIPVHNCERFLAVCEHSLVVARSRFENGQVQIVWVDDGSEDRSGAILDSFSRASSLDRVIHQANAGVSAARNMGIEVSSGEWLMFLDPDDIYHPDVFCRLSAIISKYAVDAIKFGYRSTREHVAEWDISNGDAVDVFDLSKETDFKTAWAQHLVRSRMWNGCYRRRIFDSLRFRGTPNGEDGLFAQESLGIINSLALTNTILYSYLLSPQSATQKRSLRMAEGHVLYNKLRYEIIIKWPFFPSIRNSVKRDMRSSVGGSTIGLVLALSAAEQHVCWQYFIFHLTGMFTEGILFSGLERCLYRTAFSLKSPIGILLCLRFPWWIRKTLLKSPIFQSLNERLKER